jgi:hypothetical protein
MHDGAYRVEGVGQAGAAEATARHPCEVGLHLDGSPLAAGGQVVLIRQLPHTEEGVCHGKRVDLGSALRLKGQKDLQAERQRRQRALSMGGKGRAAWTMKTRCAALW